MIRQVKNHLKNLLGWSTKKKLLVFAVDDYGNVRLNSKESYTAINKENKLINRFDCYDTLETTEDLEALFEVLCSVKDINDHNAVFTPYSLSCNIDFLAMSSVNYSKYIYELLPETFLKKETQQPQAYKNTWNLWKQGMENGLLSPEFHGREHFNLNLFEQKLNRQDSDLMLSLRNESLVGIDQINGGSINWTAAFSFSKQYELEGFKEILTSGLDAFEKVFGFRSTVFTPPSQQFHPSLYQTLSSSGVKAIDRPWVYKQHLGDGKYQWVISKTHYNAKLQIQEIVRNVVFEPNHNRGFSWVDYALAQIQSAFAHNKPAIISSHRVNFCGHIDEDNRKNGLNDLNTLLKKVKKHWPEVEFISVADLIRLIGNEDD